ncbi:MAG: signal peptidase I [Hyphomonadaceae bacterium]
MDDAAPQVEPATLGQKAKKEAREWGATLAIFIPLFYLFSFLLFEQRVIPSESMVPNLQVGDRVVVNKFAYGYGRFSVPWGVARVLPLGEGRMFARDPKRGDVAVFMHPHWKRVMIKRLIGLPGDRVQMIGERLYLNGEPVDTEFVGRRRYVPNKDTRVASAAEYTETIDGKSFLTHQLAKGQPLDTTPEFIVPEGHVFFMGDNRDNSKDARDTTGHCPQVDGIIDRAGCELTVPADFASIGFVPMDHLIGRAETVLFTTHRCKQSESTDCPPKRVWRDL